MTSTPVTAAANTCSGTVRHIVYLGTVTHYYVTSEDGEAFIVYWQNQATSHTSEPWRVGEAIHLEPDRLRTLVVVGKVAEEIVRVTTEERASLIIMGILGKKGWRRMHLDSVSEKVVQRSPVPVMTLWLPRSATSDRGRARNLVFTG